MKWINRAIELKILLILIEGILAYDIVSAFVISVQSLLKSVTASAQLKLLFLPIVCSLGLAMLWKACKYEYIMLILGQIMILVFLFHQFSLSYKIIIVIQALGVILFSIAIVRITIFLMSGQSNTFIERLLSRRLK